MSISSITSSAGAVPSEGLRRPLIVSSQTRAQLGRAMKVRESLDPAEGMGKQGSKQRICPTAEHVCGLRIIQSWDGAAVRIRAGGAWRVPASSGSRDRSFFRQEAGDGSGHGRSSEGSESCSVSSPEMASRCFVCPSMNAASLAETGDNRRVELRAGRADDELHRVHRPVAQAIRAMFEESTQGMLRARTGGHAKDSRNSRSPRWGGGRSRTLGVMSGTFGAARRAGGSRSGVKLLPELDNTFTMTNDQEHLAVGGDQRLAGE